MRLVYIFFAAILAVSIAESSDENKLYEDLEAMETMELKKEKRELNPEASAYNVPQQTWNQNYVPQNQNYVPPSNNYVTSPPYYPPVASNPPYVPPVTSSPPYVPPVSSNPSYVPPVQNDYAPPQSYPHHPTYYPWSTTPNYHVPTTTTPVSVIKNEQYYGENGSYKYEYQTSDGTHVGEEGYSTDPKGSDEALVKRGWYSFKGADGKTYTVTYWADKTGFHAYGAHLPTPPPIPAAIQEALDKAEAEKNKPTYAPPTQKPSYPQPTPGYNPGQQQPVYYPPQQTYYPPQQTYYPQQPSNPTYSK